jgi:hypothetical protein
MEATTTMLTVAARYGIPPSLARKCTPDELVLFCTAASKAAAKADDPRKVKVFWWWLLAVTFDIIVLGLAIIILAVSK